MKFTPSTATLLALVGGALFAATTANAAACCATSCNSPHCSPCERVLNANNCGSRAPCTPSVCGLDVMGNILEATQSEARELKVGKDDGAKVVA